MIPEDVMKKRVKPLKTIREKLEAQRRKKLLFKGTALVLALGAGCSLFVKDQFHKAQSAEYENPISYSALPNDGALAYFSPNESSKITIEPQKAQPNLEDRVFSHLNLSPKIQGLVDEKIFSWYTPDANGKMEIDGIRAFVSNGSSLEDYFDVFCKENAIDKNFITALVAFESGAYDLWQPETKIRAISERGAGGKMQLMPFVAEEYNLVINNYIDERFVPEKAIPAGIRRLYEGITRWGSIPIHALADYNWGPGNLSPVAQAGNDDSVFEMLPAETQKYVIRIFALKQILDNPDKYSFDYEKKPSYKEYVDNSRTYVVKRNDTFYRIVRNLNLDPKVLMIKNQEIKDFGKLKAGTVLKI